jgi:hypothetical protein
MVEVPEPVAAAPDVLGDLPDDVRAQLQSAAESLAEELGGDRDAAREAMFESALQLTRDATVLQYAPLLAARRARQRLREARHDGAMDRRTEQPD